MDRKAREIEQRRRQLEEQLQNGVAVDPAQLDSVVESSPLPRLRSSSLG
jgi:transcription elongation GreA/GreB family factor